MSQHIILLSLSIMLLVLMPLEIKADIDTLQTCYTNYLAIVNKDVREAQDETCLKDADTALANLIKSSTKSTIETYLNQRISAKFCLINRIQEECKNVAEDIDQLEQFTQLASACNSITNTYVESNEVIPPVCESVFSSDNQKLTRYTALNCLNDFKVSYAADFSNCATSLFTSDAWSTSNLENFENDYQFNKALYCDASRIDDCTARPAIATACDQTIALQYANLIKEIYGCTTLTIDSTAKTQSTTTISSLDVPKETASSTTQGSGGSGGSGSGSHATSVKSHTASLITFIALAAAAFSTSRLV